MPSQEPIIFTSRHTVELTHQPIEVDEILKDGCEMHGGKYGVRLVYEGFVRKDQGSQCDGYDLSGVVAINYETYNELFEGVTQRIIAEAQDLFPGTGPTHVVHRLNEVPLGEPTVVIVILADHQNTALDAMKFITCNMKSRCPLWKKIIRSPLSK